MGGFISFILFVWQGDNLQTTLKAVEDQFGAYFCTKLSASLWAVGHHITREDYDVDLMISEIKRIRET